MNGRTALIYSSDFGRFDYGVEHPFKVHRYRLAFELISAYGLFGPDATLVSAYRTVDEGDLLSFQAGETTSNWFCHRIPQCLAGGASFCHAHAGILS